MPPGARVAQVHTRRSQSRPRASIRGVGGQPDSRVPNPRRGCNPRAGQSLGKGRHIVLSQWAGAIPLEIVNKSETDRIERLPLPKGASLNIMRSLIEEPDARKYLTKLSAECAKDARAAVRAIEALEAISDGTRLKIAIKPLIKAACQMAILRMRTSLLGVRTGVVRSHALNLATMQRISRCSPQVLPFSRPRPEEDDKEPAPDVEIDEEEVPSVALDAGASQAGQG